VIFYTLKSDVVEENICLLFTWLMYLVFGCIFIS